MRRLGRLVSSRRSVCALLALLVVIPACKSKRKRAPLEPIGENAGLSSMINVADPHGAVQLTKGFYDLENGSWRWTARNFSVLLRPPLNAAQNGARLVLKFTIAAPSIDKLKQLRLSANVNGFALPAEEFTRAGENTYAQDVPSTALKSDAVVADFTLDKAIPPSPADPRELGVIVSAIGFEAR